MWYLTEKFQRVLDGQELPKWEDIPYRSEKDFRGGIFSNFVDNWLPIIHLLPTENEKIRTYKLIHEGLNFTDNQAPIKPENGISFRNKVKLCTSEEINTTYENKIENGADVIKDKNGVEWLKHGDVLSPRKLHYPMECKKDRNGTWSKINYHQPNQRKILDKPEEIQNQIE